MIKFLKSVLCVKDININDNLTEFCFIGRSNVGKSALINACANKKIAHSSKTPGTTKFINIYCFPNFRIIDLPGYGYAKVNKKTKIILNNSIIDYLSNRKNLFAIFLICDANYISDLDLDVYKNISKKFVNVFIVANKIDKISKLQLQKIKINFLKKFNIEKEKLFFISALKKINVSSILKCMNKLLYI